MDAQTLRALIGTAEHPEIVLRREYRATVAEVREACTSIPRLTRWFGAVGGAPAAVGDPFTVQLGADGVARGTVHTCDEHTLEVSWAVGAEPASMLSIEWRQAGAERVELVVRHRLAPPAEVPPVGGGWERALADLVGALTEPPSTQTPGPADMEAIGRWRTIASRPLEVATVIDAGRDRVWAAVASAGGLRTWWWRHWSDVTIEADVTAGGDYRIEAPAAGIVLEGRYLEVEPEERLAFSWRWSDDSGTSVDEAVEIVLTDDGDGTRVAVRHTGPWTDDAPAASYRQGWLFTLGELAAVLAQS